MRASVDHNKGETKGYDSSEMALEDAGRGASSSRTWWVRRRRVLSKVMRCEAE
jgi:hypothetical protein